MTGAVTIREDYRTKKPGWEPYGRNGHTPRCQSTNRAGGQCGRYSIPGGRVCVMHGGKSSHIRRAAKLRLLEMVDPAIATLAREMTNQNASSGERIRAAENILDRTGFSRTVNTSSDEARLLLLDRLQRMAQSGDLPTQGDVIDGEVVEDDEIEEDES